MQWTPVGCAVAAWLLMAQPAAAQSVPPDLKTLTLQELMDLSVDTPARVPQSRLHASPSVFVVTEDDIRRSGANSIPELLRLVPGLHVAQIDGNKWAIGIRGFTDRLARAMLVMIDGRAVYSPLFAGTYWEVQDLPLHDIARIEVVRGPGGALWGANAVTGIINIIRKSAAETPGVAVRVGAGTSDTAVVAARYGAAASGVHYRFSGKAAARAPQDTPGPVDYDDARLWQFGARADWTRGLGSFTAQGDVYRTVIGQQDTLTTYSPPATVTHVTDDALSGGNVLLRWTAKESDPRSLSVKAYLDRSSRTELSFRETQHVVDIDLQQGLIKGRHGLLWGTGYRYVDGRTEVAGSLRFFPANRADHLFTAFAQDEVRLIADRLALTVGTKVEHNDYSGVEWQPGARLMWTPSPAHALSFSVTRAVRTPSRVEHDFETGSLASPEGPLFVRLQRNQEFEPEELLAFEAGVVTMPHPKLLITAAAFRNQHDRVLSLELAPRFVETDAQGTREIIPVTFGNGLQGHSQGVEVSADLRPTGWLRTNVSYSNLRVRLSRRPGSNDAGQEARAEGVSPRHQVQAGVSLQLPRQMSLDWFFRHVSDLPAVRVPAYSTSNLTIRVPVNRSWSVQLTGRNLHSASHLEFAESANVLVGIRRSVFVALRWSR